jgi:hypothetical protein
MSGSERYPVKKVVGFDHAMIQAIEDWRARQKPVPKLSEAIRLLVEVGLASAPAAARRGKKTAAKASDMAGEMIDWLSDKSAPAEERAKRKRRLVKGPSEFREMRDDLPKPKG